MPLCCDARGGLWVGIVAFTSDNKNATETAKFEADSAAMRLARGTSLSNRGELEEAEMELRRALLLPMRPETRFDAQHKLADVLYATRNTSKRLESLRLYKELIVSLEVAAPDPQSALSVSQTFWTICASALRR